jgi:SpoVK/Ycf46/Vps4 family AAA+-type ATPase
VFERFTDRARRVVILAQEEARMLNHNYIGTEHILLGLIHEGEGVAAKALESLGISLEAVRSQVEEIIGEGQQAPSGHLPFTPRGKKVLELSLRESLQLAHNYIGTEHILLGLIREGEGVAAQVLVKMGADLNKVRQQVIQLLNEYPSKEPSAAAEATPSTPLLLDQIGRNLTQSARDGEREMDPVIGREKEVERVMQVLSRRTNNVPVLVGEPGIDKVAVVRTLAQAIVNDEVSGILRNADLYELDGDSLLLADVGKSGTSLSAALQEASSRGRVVLFIDELHALLQKDEDDDDDDDESSNRRKLLQGAFPIIGGTTPDDYMHVERNPMIGGSVLRIDVREPSVEETVELLKGRRDLFEAHHRVSITDAALITAAVLAHRYVRNKFLPESAIDLIDEAGARLSVRRTKGPMHLRELSERIVETRREKESLIDAQDYEKAASFRDREKTLLAEMARSEEAWQTGGNPDIVAEVDSREIQEALVSTVSGLSVDKILRSLQSATAEPDARRQSETERQYALLSDEPLRSEKLQKKRWWKKRTVYVDGTDDVLNSRQVAIDIASIISRAPTPFVLAVDGGWGVGKSTILNQIECKLPDRMVKVTYNAWTAHGHNALEGLIKSVLVELDPNVIRKWARRVAKQRGVLAVARIWLALFARLLGVPRLVDKLWDRLSVDAQARNELRDITRKMVADWLNDDRHRQQGKALVVFVDDLDRCSDGVVVEVCEAIKLYLDAPGVIFVIACDLAVLARGVANEARGGMGEGRLYLEKIVQVAHRVQAPDRESAERLVSAYAERSGTADLIDDTIAGILAERTDRNPRRIKRIINSFVLEHHLNKAWRTPPLGSEELMTAVLLQHLYPSFYDRVVDEKGSVDPIGDFLDYADVRLRASAPPDRRNAWWSTVSRVFRKWGMPVPDRSAGSRDGILPELERLEQRWLPPDYPTLARNEAFLGLLQGIGDGPTRITFRSTLMGRPRGNGPLTIEPVVDTAGTGEAAVA